MSARADLTIAGLDATVVRVPRPSRFRPQTSKGAPTHSEYVVLQLRTAGGRVGLGEATTSPAWNGEDAVGTADLLARVVGPELVGLRVDDWGAVRAVVDGRVRSRPFLRAAVEMACLDAEGQARGLPVAALLGGVHRDAFATKFVLPARDPELVGAMAADAVRAGARALKVKVGLDLSADLARLDRVRSAIGGLPLSVDANEGWDPAAHRRIAHGLGPLGLVAVEQPFPVAAVEETVALRAAVSAELVADEAVWTAADLLAEPIRRAFSEVSLYPGKVGGLRRCVRLATLAAERGFGVSYGSNLELGIGAAALAHALAATPSVSAVVGSDLIGPLYFEHALVEDASFVRFDGAVLPGAGPSGGAGLGVRLDGDALGEYALAGSVAAVIA